MFLIWLPFTKHYKQDRVEATPPRNNNRSNGPHAVEFRLRMVG